MDNKNTEPFNIKRLGVMGGTFDPIHIGHLITASTATYKFNLDKVLFIPTGQPPHKTKVSDAEERFTMTLLATVTNPFFEVSRIEIDRIGPTYTVDTVKELKSLYPNVDLYFITGADAILDILTWRNVKEVMENVTFIASTRPGFDTSQVKEQIIHLQDKHGGEIYFLEVPGIAVSSTQIRKWSEIGRPIKYLVPETVEHYIEKKRLYI